MKKYIFLLAILLLISKIEIQCDPEFIDLIVNIENIENNEGNIRVQLFDESVKEAFPLESEKAIRLEITDIANNKAQVIFKNIPYGIYVVSAHHDKNLNAKMDKNILGLPTEGWGVSNNIKPIMRIPNFDECSFYAGKDKFSIYITMNN
jgi:uncharacterized protein (DUF2141 family)